MENGGGAALGERHPALAADGSLRPMGGKARVLFSRMGGKACHAHWLLSALPRRPVYVEPFFGTGAVFFARARAPKEIINDRDEGVANFFRVLRDDCAALTARLEATEYSEAALAEAKAVGADAEPVVRAWAFLVKGRMSVFGQGDNFYGLQDGVRNIAGARFHNVVLDLPAFRSRLQGGVEIINRDATEVVRLFETDESALLYLDPPYLKDALGGDERAEYYEHEMTEAEHARLLEGANRCRGAVAVSFYDGPGNRLYREMLRAPKWRLVEGRRQWTSAGSLSGKKAAPRPEALMVNYEPPAAPPVAAALPLEAG